MTRGGNDGSEGLLAGAAAIEQAGGPERRHEVLMARAEEWGLSRTEAEAVYAMAEAEGAEPELALLLAATGVGVRELEPIENAPQPELGSQAVPPDWVAVADVAPAEARRERSLRLSFRRLQAMLAETGSAVEAARRFLGEPDVVEDAY